MLKIFFERKFPLKNYPQFQANGCPVLYHQSSDSEFYSHFQRKINTHLPDLILFLILKLWELVLSVILFFFQDQIYKIMLWRFIFLKVGKLY